MSDSLRPHESQHTRPPCPSPTPGVHSDSHPSSQKVLYCLRKKNLFFLFIILLESFCSVLISWNFLKIIIVIYLLICSLFFFLPCFTGQWETTDGFEQDSDIISNVFRELLFHNNNIKNGLEVVASQHKITLNHSSTHSKIWMHLAAVEVKRKWESTVLG